MRSLKKLGVVMVAVFALSAVAAASASATAFTAGSTGALSGSAENAQVFNNPSGTVTCNNLSTPSTNVTATTANTQAASIKYESCSANFIFNFAVTISTASYTFTAGGSHASCNSSSGNTSCNNPSNTTVVINNPININSNVCSITVPAQKNTSTNYATSGNKLTIQAAVTGIKSTVNSGNVCANSNTGTYNGNSLASSNSPLSYDS